MIESAEALLDAARERGLALRAQGVELDTSGADFVVAHAVDEAGTRWVVRSPRRGDVLERAARERRALELVRPRLPVSVPEWRLFSPEVIAYPRLDGDPAAVVDLDAGGYVWRFDETAPPAAFLDSLAAVLAALHGIDPASAAAAGLPVRAPAGVRDLFAGRMERAREVLTIPDAVWRRWQDWIEDDGSWPERSALIHGDLHPAHLLVDGEHRVVGVLDWTEAQVGDPATDLALLYATLGRGALRGLLRRYADAGGPAWPRLEEHVVETWSAYPVVVAEFARTSGEDGPLRLAQALVDAGSQESGAR